MPACIRKFSADHPGVRLRIQMDAPDVLGRALRARTIDIAVAEGSVLEQDAGLEVVDRLAPTIPGCFVARTAHPLRSKAAVTMTDLFAYPFAQVISFPPRILKPMLAQRARIRGDLPPFPSIECPSLLLAKCAVLESYAVTVATLVLIEEELLAGTLAPILELPWMQSNWMIFKLRGRSLGPAALVLIEELRLAHQAFVRDESALRKKWLRRARPNVSARKAAPSRSGEK